MANPICIRDQLTRSKNVQCYRVRISWECDKNLKYLAISVALAIPIRGNTPNMQIVHPTHENQIIRNSREYKTNHADTSINIDHELANSCWDIAKQETDALCHIHSLYLKIMFWRCANCCRVDFRCVACFHLMHSPAITFRQQQIVIQVSSFKLNSIHTWTHGCRGATTKKKQQIR